MLALSTIYMYRLGCVWSTCNYSDFFGVKSFRAKR